MFKTLLGEVKTGRLPRLPYIGYSILLSFIFIAIGLGIAVGLGVVERIIGGDLQQTQTMLRENFGIPGMIGIIFVFAWIVFAHLNLLAKRIRDMGLPGWWGVLAISILFGLISGMAAPGASELISSGLQATLWLAIVLIPSGSFTGQHELNNRR